MSSTMAKHLLDSQENPQRKLIRLVGVRIEKLH